MKWGFIALLVLRLTLNAQEDERKPSPFPEKNREREAAAKKSVRSPGSKRVASSHPRTETADRTDLTVPDGASVGKACFFSSKSGRSVTASGVDANADELVAAAHSTYPLGGRVKVKNLANGRLVELTITDRLADSRRIISVSEAAARQLGFYESGIADVTVEVVRADERRR